MPRLLLPLAVAAFLLTAGQCSVVRIDAGSFDDIATNPCTRGWTNASADNHLSCAEATAWEHWITSRAPLITVPVAMGLLMLLSCQCVFAGRYGFEICGSNRQRPGHWCKGGEEWDKRTEAERKTAYSDREICLNKAATVPLLGFAIAFVIIMVLGAQKFSSGVTEVEGGWNNTINFFRNITDGVDRQTRRADGTTPLPDGIFTTIQKGLRDAAATWQSTQSAESAAKSITVFFSVFAGIPALLLVLGVLAAVCNIRRNLPVTLVYCSFILAFLYGLAGSTFLLGEAPLDLICGAFRSQLDRQPGVFQWFIVPKCQDSNVFGIVKHTMARIESRLALSTCDDLLQICSPGLWYNFSDPDRIFACEISLANCTDYAAVRQVADTLTLKLLVPEGCGPFTLTDNCTLENCAEYCSTPQLRNAAGSAFRGLNDTYNIFTAIDIYIEPWLNCNALLDRIVEIAAPICNNLPSGLHSLGVACLIVVVGMYPVVPVYLMGQKRFFSPKDKLPEGVKDPSMMRLLNDDGNLDPSRIDGVERSGDVEMESVPIAVAGPPDYYAMSDSHGGPMKAM